MFVMLNPSTADATADDPTARRCMRFARDWGCGGLLIVNLYAWRATSPADLWRATDPVGAECDRYITTAARIARASGGPLVAAWGSLGRPWRIRDVMALPGMERLSALDVTRDGQPRHPLYLRASLTPQDWTPPEVVA